jgi:hypothetical protein
MGPATISVASEGKQPRLDLYSDPLPEEAVARWGNLQTRFTLGAHYIQ